MKMGFMQDVIIFWFYLHVNGKGYVVGYGLYKESNGVIFIVFNVSRRPHMYFWNPEET